MIKGVPINTEKRKLTREGRLSESNDTISTSIENGKKFLKSVCSELARCIKNQVDKPKVVTLTKQAFNDWNMDKLKELYSLAQRTESRDYGDLDTLVKQYIVLKERVKGCSWKKGIHPADMWLKICTDESFYSTVEDVIHLAICSFIKSPIEAVVESIGSVINAHGSEQRSSMLPGTLEDEVMVAWNGPEEFSEKTQEILKTVLNKHFKGLPHFYVNASRIKVISKDMSRIISKPSRFDF